MDYSRIKLAQTDSINGNKELAYTFGTVHLYLFILKKQRKIINALTQVVLPY